MNISGIRTYAGFYDYNTIKTSEARIQQIQEAKVPAEQPEREPENIPEALTVTEPKKPDHGASEYAKQYQPDAVYELKGADSDIAGLDVEKALSDMQKDKVLQQYQFFVGERIAQESNGLNEMRENENFYL